MLYVAVIAFVVLLVLLLIKKGDKGNAVAKQIALGVLGAALAITLLLAGSQFF